MSQMARMKCQRNPGKVQEHIPDSISFHPGYMLDDEKHSRSI